MCFFSSDFAIGYTMCTPARSSFQRSFETAMPTPLVTISKATITVNNPHLAKKASISISPMIFPCVNTPNHFGSVSSIEAVPCSHLNRGLKAGRIRDHGDYSMHSSLTSCHLSTLSPEPDGFYHELISPIKYSALCRNYLYK